MLKGPDALANVRANVNATKTVAQNVVNAPRGFDPTSQSFLEQQGNFQNSRYKTELLQFPSGKLDDKGLGNHGHYVMFYINTQTKARLRTSGQGSGGSVVDDPGAGYEIPEFINNWDAASGSYQSKRNIDGAKKQAHRDQIDAQKNQEALEIASGSGGFESPKQSGTKKVIDRKEFIAGGSTIRIKRAATKRLKGGIAMYMPSSVQVTYGANYTDTEIGDVTGNALDAYNQFTQGRFTEAAESVFRIPQSAQDGVRNLLLGTIGALPGMGGTREAFEMKAGEIITDRLELAFKGINKRVFQYNFKMIPKNEDEAKAIRKIVFAFKANMLPEFEGGRAGRRLIVPNTFDIQYMYMGSQNQFLHHISTCVLENMNVAYGGDRYKTFNASEDGAPPVETNLTLNFKELELITRERVFEGY
tara:strand:- start:1712 stop:2962 length:1251 start_codon:yes stop_codon:yes gene_type:complete